MSANASGADPAPVQVRRLILASQSPRRRQILSLLGLPFVVKATGVDERPLDGEAPASLVQRVSQAKAYAALAEEARPDELIVAADTIVVLEGNILGKPVDEADAVHMLRRLRARPHTVYSGVAVWHPARRQMAYELGETTVWMRDYTEEEIERYVASRDPLDKAGAYAIQHPAFDPVARIEGCWLGVVGLPLCHLSRALRQFGVTMPGDLPGSCDAFSQNACQISSEILGQRR